jgi:hypothetical protein
VYPIASAKVISSPKTLVTLLMSTTLAAMFPVASSSADVVLLEERQVMSRKFIVGGNWKCNPKTYKARG